MSNSFNTSLSAWHAVVEQLWSHHLELSLLLLLVIAARFLLKRTARCHNAYLLWASIPIALIVAIVLPQWQVQQPQVAEAARFVQTAGGLLEQGAVSAPLLVVDETQPFIIAAGLGVLWFTVALFLLMRLGLQHRALRQQLTDMTVAVPLKLGTKYKVVAVDNEQMSPAVYGFTRPTIFFPVHLHRQLSAEQQRLIIEHEEHHIRQGHLWLNLLWDIAVCLMWFNPLLYLARQQFRHDQELYCDYLVLKRTAASQSQSYGHALLTTVSATHSVSLLCSWNAFNQLEERIMSIKSKTTRTQRGLLATVAAVLIAFTTLYSVNAADGENAEEQQKPERVVIKKEKRNSSVYRYKDGDIERVDDNGERYIIEDGERREMTKDESREFDKHIARIREIRPGLPPAPTVIEIDKEFQNSSITSWSDDRDGVRFKFVDENGERYVVENGERRAMTDAESEEFDRHIEKVGNDVPMPAPIPRPRSASKVIVIDKDHDLNFDFDYPFDSDVDVRIIQDQDVELIKDGVSFHDKNGERYAVEDGVRRELTDAEAKVFAKELEASKRLLEHRDISLHEHLGAGVDVETLLRDNIPDARVIRMEMERGMSEMARANVELERVQQEIEIAYQEGRLQKRERDRVLRDLERSQAELQRDQERLKRDIAKLQKDIEKARTKASRRPQ